MNNKCANNRSRNVKLNESNTANYGRNLNIIRSVGSSSGCRVQNLYAEVGLRRVVTAMVFQFLILCRVEGGSDPCICSFQSDEWGVKGRTDRQVWRRVQLGSVFFMFQVERIRLTRRRSGGSCPKANMVWILEDCLFWTNRESTEAEAQGWDGVEVQ